MTTTLELQLQSLHAQIIFQKQENSVKPKFLGNQITLVNQVIFPELLAFQKQNDSVNLMN